MPETGAAAPRIPPPPLVPRRRLPLPPMPGRQGRIISATRRGAQQARAGALRQAWNLLRAGLIDTTDLPTGTRRLIDGAYIFILAMIGMTLLLEAFGSSMPLSPVPANLAGPDASMVPLPALVASTLSFLGGWALLLTGATDCGRRIFVPVALALGLQLLWIVLNMHLEPGARLYSLLGAVALLSLGTALLHAFTRRSSRWRGHPLVECLAWIVALAVFFFFVIEPMDLLLRGRVNIVNISYVWLLLLELITAILVFVLFPFWLFLGLGGADLAWDLGRKLGARHLPRLDGRASRVLVAGCILMLAIIVAPKVQELWRTFVVPDLPVRHRVLFSVALTWPIVPLGLLVWMLVLLVMRRWTARAAAVGTILAICWAAQYGAGLVALGNRQDLVGFAVAAPGLIPTTVLFVGLTAYGVLTFGARYADRGSTVLPRTGRALMHLGLVLLVLCTLTLTTHDQAATTVEGMTSEASSIVPTMLDVATFDAVIFISPVYLIGRLWLRRRTLLDADAEDAPTPPLAVVGFVLVLIAVAVMQMMPILTGEGS